MNREILFRGLRADGKGWVCGGYLPGVIHATNQAGGCLGSNTDGSVSIGIDAWNVVESSVGQFTGMTDKNGVKIFEGDIVRTHVDPIDRSDLCPEEFFDEVVEFSHGVYHLTDMEPLYDCVMKDEMEVVSNIHEMKPEGGDQ
jgi:uncharacterized phage protein (TIGR01671 family)